MNHHYGTTADLNELPIDKILKLANKKLALGWRADQPAHYPQHFVPYSYETLLEALVDYIEKELTNDNKDRTDN